MVGFDITDIIVGSIKGSVLLCQQTCFRTGHQREF